MHAQEHLTAEELKITPFHNVRTRMCSFIEHRYPQSTLAFQIGTLYHFAHRQPRHIARDNVLVRRNRRK